MPTLQELHGFIIISPLRVTARILITISCMHIIIGDQRSTTIFIGSDSTLWNLDWSSVYASPEVFYTVFIYKITTIHWLSSVAGFFQASYFMY